MYRSSARSRRWATMSWARTSVGFWKHFSTRPTCSRYRSRRSPQRFAFAKDGACRLVMRSLQERTYHCRNGAQPQEALDEHRSGASEEARHRPPVISRTSSRFWGEGLYRGVSLRPYCSTCNRSDCRVPVFDFFEGMLYSIRYCYFCLPSHPLAASCPTTTFPVGRTRTTTLAHSAPKCDRFEAAFRSWNPVVLPCPTPCSSIPAS